MHDGDDRLVGEVRAQPEEVPQGPVHDDGNRRPVLAVRLEEITEVAGVALGEKAPFVAEEPAMASDHEDDQNACRDGVHRERNRRRMPSETITCRRGRPDAPADDSPLPFDHGRIQVGQ